MLTCAYCLNICFYPKASLQLEAFLEQLFGVSLSEDLVYKIQQTAKQPKASIFERLPSEDIEYYQDIHKRAAEFSWGEKRDFFQKETEITHLNKGKQQLENNTQENRDLRVEYILVEWLDMEKEEKNIVEVKQQEQNHQEFLLKDKKTSLSKSQLTHKVPHAQYILLHEGTGNAQKHGIANFGFGIIQIYRYDEEKISTVDERWNNEKLSSKDKVVAVLAVPSYMTTSDFLEFVGEDVKNQVSHFRFIRTSAPNRYMVLLKFRRFKDAKAFYNTFNGELFNAIEPEKCHIMFIKHIFFESKQIQESKILPVPTSTKLIPSTLGLRELPTCVVCLERMDASVTGLLTILCQHTFHCQCLSKWGENICPVCRYSQKKDTLNTAKANSQCSVCETQKNLWICLICGHIGCGRYDLAHAYQHYTNTGHCYSMDIETERVWDYAGDSYVHRLIQNKIDGNLVKFPSTYSNINTNSTISEKDELDLKNKLESMSLEYTYLLTSQLDFQRTYYENKIMAVTNKAKKALEEEKHAKKEIFNIMEKFSELQENLNQSKKNLEDLKKLNSQNEKKAEKFCELAQRIEKELEEEKLLNSKLMQRIEHLNVENSKMKSDSEDSKKKIQDLSDQLRDVMFYISSQEQVNTMDDTLKQELQNGTICIPQKSKKKYKK